MTIEQIVNDSYKTPALEWQEILYISQQMLVGNVKSLMKREYIFLTDEFPIYSTILSEIKQVDFKASSHLHKSMPSAADKD